MVTTCMASSCPWSHYRTQTSSLSNQQWLPSLPVIYPVSPATYTLKFFPFHSNICNSCWFHEDTYASSLSFQDYLSKYNLYQSRSKHSVTQSEIMCGDPGWLFPLSASSPLKFLCLCEIKIASLFSSRLLFWSPLVTDLPKTKSFWSAV